MDDAAVCLCGAAASLRGVHGVFCSPTHARNVWLGEALEPNVIEPQLVRVDAVSMLTTPLSREDMGRANWVAMHALVGALEDDVATSALTPSDLADVRAYIGILTRLYPCEECRRHFDALVMQFPPTFTTARGAQLWVAERHNDVNRRLGKRVWPTDEPTAPVGRECR